MDQRFSGKVVVVTGAAGGIGRAAAQRFAAEGARLALVDLPGTGLNDAAAAVQQAGGTAVAIAADVRIAGQVDNYAQQAATLLGGIDILFNNAGIEGATASLLDYPEEVFDRVIAVNVKGVWLGIRAIVPYLRKRGGGAIVNTASVAGLRGTPNLVAYGASKHAVIGITRSAALEFAGDGIRVNAICPAPIETRMMRALERGADPDDPEAVHARIAVSIPLGRYGTPDEVAGLVTFLSSPDASFISGGIYTIDGGRMA